MWKRCLSRLRRDESGLGAIEMGILAPVIITMLLGLFQTGLYLQAQNALRGVSGEMSREIMVEFQKGNHLSNDQIRLLALNEATGAPYLLDVARLNVIVDDEETQSINKVTKKYITVEYEVPNVVGFVKIGALSLDLKRVIFIPGPEIVADDGGGGDGGGVGF